MFEGFETREIDCGDATIFCRIKGSGEPLLLLHGYPQTGAMWAPIAEQLAERFLVVVADLRGYGRSSAPESTGGEAYSKRRMAGDMVALMSALGHERFHLAGHDRGARVAYRLAFDHPEKVMRLALLDIIPTVEMWERVDAAGMISAYHWAFLARPNPLPERLIASDPVFYLDQGEIHRALRLRGAGRISQELLAPHRHPWRLRGLPRRRDDRPGRRRGGPQGRPSSRLPDPHPLGHGWHAGQEGRSADHLEGLGRPCGGPGDRCRPFPRGGSPGRDAGRADALLRRLNPFCAAKRNRLRIT